MRKQLLFLFSIVIITLLPSCVQNSSNFPVIRKIEQSLKIHDDNVNGINLRVQNVSLRENANFHYNNSGLLDSMDIFSNTISGSTLVRSLKLIYYNDKVRAVVFDTAGSFELDLYFDSNRNITKMVDPFGSGCGIYLDYINNKISEIKVKSTIDSFYYTNFVYDGNNNLIQFIITDKQSQPNFKINIYYDLSKNITNDLDLKFSSKGVKFLYAGGVNVLSFAKLNYGLSTKNRIIKRTEENLQTGGSEDSYLFDYTTNNNDEITNRKIVINDTTDVFYEYRYQN